MADPGICSFGAYVPRLRLLRGAIAEAHRWASPSAKGSTKGARAYCNFDEDSITMAVSAARRALGADCARSAVRTLLLASTSLPFADRQNATVVGEALALGDQLHTSDMTGSQRAGTSALIHALRCGQPGLVIAADRSLTRPGSPQEYSAGDGAAAFVLGTQNVLAWFRGAQSSSSDFVDHYRLAQASFDYSLEERWVREEGYQKIVPATVKRLLESTGTSADAVDCLVMGGAQAAAAAGIARACGIRAEAVRPALQERFGYAGCAHALLLLADALQEAKPGQKIVLVGFGQGCDALLFEASDEITRAQSMHGVQASLELGRDDDNYMRYLSNSRLIDMDWGMRAERDVRTAQSAHYRVRDMITAFTGGRCSACGTLQFPRTRLCVNPGCNSLDTQSDELLQDRVGHIKSFTEDWLALSFSPPLTYGNVSFGDRAVLMMEFTNFDPGQIEIGAAVRMEFRVKDFDRLRNFHRYFWKAAPAGRLG